MLLLLIPIGSDTAFIASTHTNRSNSTAGGTLANRLVHLSSPLPCHPRPLRLLHSPVYLHLSPAPRRRARRKQRMVSRQMGNLGKWRSVDLRLIHHCVALLSKRAARDRREHELGWANRGLCYDIFDPGLGLPRETSVCRTNGEDG